MPDTQRVLSIVDMKQGDFDLTETLLTSRSPADALLAYSMLRATHPVLPLVMFANLREIIAELPETPFGTGDGMEVLAQTAGYEFTGRSYRRLFETGSALFGLEFLGDGKLCEGIVVHTATSRLVLRGDEDSVIDHALVAALVNQPTLLDAILEALQVLEHPLEPRIYLTVDDFIDEYASSAASSAFADTF